MYVQKNPHFSLEHVHVPRLVEASLQTQVSLTRFCSTAVCFLTKMRHTEKLFGSVQPLQLNYCLTIHRKLLPD